MIGETRRCKPYAPRGCAAVRSSYLPCTLQKLFDRTLSKLPVLLVLIGSDLSMMESLNTYGRPFYQRGTEMVVPPLNPAEVAAMRDTGPADAFDAYLVSGGLPLPQPSRAVPAAQDLDRRAAALT